MFFIQYLNFVWFFVTKLLNHEYTFFFYISKQYDFILPYSCIRVYPDPPPPPVELTPGF